MQLTASIDANQNVVINADESVELGGLVIESSNAGLASTDDASAAPFTFFLERNDESVTLGSLGSFVAVEESFTTTVTADPGAELSLQWFQRGSYEVFSTSDGVAASSVSPTSLVGDIDNDGTVGFPDFLILSDSFGQQVTAGEAGDIDGDGNVGFADFLMLSDNFGAAAAADVSSVPEPSANCMLAVLGSLALVARKRRRA